MRYVNGFVVYISNYSRSWMVITIRKEVIGKGGKDSHANIEDSN